MSLAPAFVTHREIEGFLGGGAGGKRQRQRLQHRELLPEPFWLPRVDRTRIAIYPAFALAGLVNALAAAPDVKQRVRKQSTKVFDSAAFRELNEALQASAREVLRAQQQWRFDAFVQYLGEIAEPVVVEWDAVVREAADALTPWGVTVSSEAGCVERRSGNTYFVLLSGERTERFSAERVAVPQMHKGSAVTVEHVRVMGDGLDVVMPALKTREPETTSAPDLWDGITEQDWDDVLTAASAQADDFAFAHDYWRDDVATATPVSGFRLPLNPPSGREAAAQLLAQRAKA